VSSESERHQKRNQNRGCQETGRTDRKANGHTCRCSRIWLVFQPVVFGCQIAWLRDMITASVTKLNHLHLRWFAGQLIGLLLFASGFLAYAQDCGGSCLSQHAPNAKRSNSGSSPIVLLATLPATLTLSISSVNLSIPVVELDKDFESGLSISPDGRWVLYSQANDVNGDIMLVDHFR
jgi:hypothetical protein